MDFEKWQGKRYYSLSAYFKNEYGARIEKISVDAGLSCPNRDGTLGDRGCIFCSAGGSGDFAQSIDAVDEAINNYKCNGKGSRYVIYFQAFTNTYGDIDYLERIWSYALSKEDVIGISIATRPDCLGDEVLSLLKKLRDKCDNLEFGIRKFIWIELGLQTIHETTATYIRRGYSLDVYDEAIDKLSKIKIPYITHVILGLPFETPQMMLETVSYVSARNPFGIKLQLLHVLENTDLAKEYEAGKFEVLTMEEYLDILIDCIRNLKPDIVIHRVTGDGPKNILIAPKWSGNKKYVLNQLHKMMKNCGAYQGENIV